MKTKSAGSGVCSVLPSELMGTHLAGQSCASMFPSLTCDILNEEDGMMMDESLSTLLSASSNYALTSSPSVSQHDFAGSSSCSPTSYHSGSGSSSGSNCAGDDEMDNLMRDQFNTDSIFSAADITDLDLDLLPELPQYNENGDLPNFLIDQENNSSSSSTSTNCYAEFLLTTTPPLTPPSPPSEVTEIKIEPSDSPTTSISSPSISSILLPPQLKSTRGRSASHDSPDVLAMKRHIRMIRNRESASLSRKKKKEYVTSLEARIRELENEVKSLKEENTRLKMGQRLHNNPNPNSSAPITKNGKKVLAKMALFSLFCFVFVTFQPKVVRNELKSNNVSEFSKTLENFDPNVNLRGKRSLGGVWAEGITIEDENTKVKFNFSEIVETLERDKDVKHFESNFGQFRNNGTSKSNSNGFMNNTNVPKAQKRPKFESNSNYVKKKSFVQQQQQEEHSYANLTKNSSSNSSSGRNNSASGSAAASCRDAFNKTESMRVQNDLHGIFSKAHPKKKTSPPVVATKPIVYSLIDLSGDNSNHNKVVANGNNNVDFSKGLTIYDQKMSDYSEILEKLQRREDTFYVVSLTPENQLLLSAKASNSSARPKMTFLMPWRNETFGGKEQLMQIDCEVFQISNLNQENQNRNNKKRSNRRSYNHNNVKRG